MKKPMIVMLVALGILFGGIFAYKTLGHFMMMRFFSSQASPVIVVSAKKASKENWLPQIKAVGNIRAVQGVDVTSSLSGLVQKIYFTPGSMVVKDQVLVQLDADAEIAQLHSLEAKEKLAEKTYLRDKAQFLVKAISKAALETSEANWKSLQAEVLQQQAIVNKKTIRAPFAGQLGISRINLGQYLNPGDVIVNLQDLNLLYVDFYLPQQDFAKLAINQKIEIRTDAYPGKIFHGQISTINPILNKQTRNVEVEAMFKNDDMMLRSGMFVDLTINSGSPKQMLTLPQAAITFNSYGDIVYVISESSKYQDGKSNLIANQTFISIGEKRGDQVAVVNGIKEGDLIVTSGQIKLKNGSRVVINNTIQPEDSVAPIIPNDHKE